MIDHPSNKSGLQSFPEFPVFISKQESFVYYDHDTLYNRNRFAYHIYPFILDSLDNFSTDNLQFDGYLVSSGIFPDIKQPLKVQPDYSLGFINQSPDEGYTAYLDKGKYFEEVNLSNQGLRGKGQLKYLTSNTISDNFLFYPDSMITVLAKHFTVDPQIAKVEYPKVTADSIYQVWYPYHDTMHLQTLSIPFKMYNEKALLTGDLYYSSKGLTGGGKVGFENVELASEKYKFSHHMIDADTLDFRLFTKGKDDLAVSAEKYRTHVDFETRVVEFKTNEKGSTVSFPYNNFVCFMDNIDWYMDQHEMKLYNDLGGKYAGIDRMTREELLKLDFSGSDFLATNPQADSLSFFPVTSKTRIKIARTIQTVTGYKAMPIPSNVATPFPPWKPANKGKTWPRTTAAAKAIFRNTNWSLPTWSETKKPASITAIQPLKTSKIKTGNPAFQPSTLMVLVAPAFPLP